MSSLAGIPCPVKRTNQFAVIDALGLREDICRAYWRGKPLDLTRTEFTIVRCLATRLGIDLTYWRIFEIARGKYAIGYGGDDPSNAVRCHIKRIRAKFHMVDPEFDRIENYPKFGYRWRETA